MVNLKLRSNYVSKTITGIFAAEWFFCMFSFAKWGLGNKYQKENSILELTKRTQFLPLSPMEVLMFLVKLILKVFPTVFSFQPKEETTVHKDFHQDFCSLFIKEFCFIFRISHIVSNLFSLWKWKQMLRSLDISGGKKPHSAVV